METVETEEKRRKKFKELEELEDAIENFKDYFGLRGVKITDKTLAIKSFDSFLSEIFKFCQYREEIIHIIIKKFPEYYIWDLVTYLSSCDCCEKCTNKLQNHYIWRTIDLLEKCDSCKKYYSNFEIRDLIVGMDFFNFCKECNKPKKEKKCCNCPCNELYQVFVEALYELKNPKSRKGKKGKK